MMTDTPGDTRRPLAFRKMHGLGNDFVVIDARGRADAVTPALARAIGDRHRGVGFDQLVVLREAPDADAAVEFWNADGSRAGACGNASRCVAALLMREGVAAPVLRTAAGLLPATRGPGGQVTVDMGPAATDWRAIPLAEPADTVALPLPGAPGAVSMGNPHCVFLVEDAEAVDLATEGPRWETHPLFPERANIGVCTVLAPDRLRLRVWERGTGATLACGSGACAAVVAAARKGEARRRATVELDGGPLLIDWGADGHVRMTGPVTEVFEGVLAPGWLAAVEGAPRAEAVGP
jgi:diaminopimelate epimerase